MKKVVLLITIFLSCLLLNGCDYFGSLHYLDRDEYYFYTDGELQSFSIELENGYYNFFDVEEDYSIVSLETKRGIGIGSSAEELAELYSDIPCIIEYLVMVESFSDYKDFRERILPILNEKDKYSNKHIVKYFSSFVDGEYYNTRKIIRYQRKQNIKPDDDGFFPLGSEGAESYGILFLIEDDIITDISIIYEKNSKK